MKSKMFKSTLSVLLVLLLCFSVLAPTVSAAEVGSSATGDGDELPVVALHVSGGNPPRASMTESIVENLFAELDLGEGDYYGVKQKSASGNPTNLSGLSSSTNVNAGEYTVYRTAVTSGTLIKTPNWNAGVSQDITVRLYVNATFTVSGCEEGELYLNGESVTGTAELYTDTEYTVTAKQVDDYSCNISGVTSGVPFSPTADMTVGAEYVPNARATVTKNVTGEGTAKIMVDNEEANGFISVGASFTVDAQANTDKGYQLDSIVVTKNGAEIEGPEYGPAENGDEFVVNVTFVFAPEEVNYEVNAASPRLRSSDFNTMFSESGTRSYGYASVDDPGSISSLNLITGTDFAAGEYIIYSTAYSLLSPNWDNAKVRKLNLRSYYNATFTVTGNEEGEVYLNNSAAGDTAKLYTDTEYTVTAKNVDDYLYTMTGAEDGVAFTPTAEVNVTVAYYKEAYATFTVNVTGEGNAVVKSNGETVTERVSEGDAFTVEATPNTDKGYKLDSVVVTKNGEVVEAVDGAYGPVADGEAYVIAVNFKFEPDEVNLELHADSYLTSSNIRELFGDSLLDMATKSYGFASVDTPNEITNATILGDSVEAGEYYIYRTGMSTNPNWANAKVLKMNLRTYYNATFTVTGHEEGEVYLNNQPVSGSVKLYTDTEYTVTAKEINEYLCTMTGAEDGVAFTPSADVEVTVAYYKEVYATFTVNVTGEGNAVVKTNGEAVTERVSEGDTFTVEATPNTDKGYKLDSIVVTKNGEVVEAVDGAYGPVADGEAYVIAVNFKFEPDEVNLELHADSYLTSSNIRELFGDSLLDMATKSYGFASVDTPNEITNATILGDSVEAGEYYIYRTGMSTNPNWANAKVLKMNLRTYYNATFTVTGHEEGEVYLNNQPVSGSVKLYTDTEYTVTAKEINEYLCTMTGAEDGVAFTPSADVDVTVSYSKLAYATISLDVNEGGNVTVRSGEFTVTDRVNEGDSFTVEATANANNAYYVESVVVTKDGEEVEAVDGEYGPVADGEAYVITVTFAKATLTLNDGEVSLRDVYFKNYDAVEQAILACAELLPAEFADNAQTKVEYAAYNLLGYEVFEPLTYSNDLSHPFGTSERGGTLKGGNTERVRVTVTLPDYGIELRATATMTVNDDRIATAVESSSNTLTITYGDDLKAAVLDMISVISVEDQQPVEFTEDDITLTPDKLNANLLSALRAQEVTVRYKGTEVYAIAETKVNVYVRRAQSSLDAKSETITYGEAPEAKVITTPENLDYIKVIAGIDGETQGFVSIDIPESVKERMQIKIGDLVVLDIYQVLSNYIGEGGATINTFKDFINDIYNRIGSSELIRQAIENSGFNMEILDGIMSFINELPDFESDLKIRLGQVPANAGAYLMFAVSTDTNYTTSSDLSYIIIKPKTTTEDETYELRFREEMQGDSELQFLSYEEAQEFDFAGDYFVNGEVTESDKLHTLYIGVTFGGDFIAQSEPVTVPGVYTETVFIFGGNYFAEPIFRPYTINRLETPIKMDDLTVPYDGEAHTIEAYFEDGAELTGNVSTYYYGSSYFGNDAPVNAGEYTVYTIYAGDELHMASSTTATLTIEKLDAVITVTCKDEVAYSDIGYGDLAAAEIGYTVTGTINDESLGIIVPFIDPGETFPNIGEYTVSVIFIQTNPNYNVTVENATLNIVPKQLVVTVNDAEKYIGTVDPDFTYTVTDTDGNVLDLELDIKIARDVGEKLGTYRIFIHEFNETNYALNEASADGVLTINEKPEPRQFVLGDANGDGIVNIRDITAIQRHIAEYQPLTDLNLLAADVDGNGTVDISDATWIQRCLAEMDCPYDIGNTAEERI